MRWLTLALVLAAIAGCSGRLFESKADWERGAVDAQERAREPSVPLPPYPNDADLIEFFPGPLGSHRYFIDAKTLNVGSDGIVRYAVVVRTAGGAVNAGYEGIRCPTAEKRTYALGHAARKWIEAKRSEWEPIRADRRNEYQAALYTDYLCPEKVVVRDAETALNKLRMGLFEMGSPRTSD